jgi:hypothetical protein
MIKSKVIFESEKEKFQSFYLFVCNLTPLRFPAHFLQRFVSSWRGNICQIKLCPNKTLPHIAPLSATKKSV